MPPRSSKTEEPEVPEPEANTEGEGDAVAEASDQSSLDGMVLVSHDEPGDLVLPIAGKATRLRRGQETAVPADAWREVQASAGVAVLVARGALRVRQPVTEG